MKEKRESTSIKVIPSLWKKSKIEAICDDMEISDYVAESLEFWNIHRLEFRKK